MSEQDDFKENFERLTENQKQTLAKLVRGDSDLDIAHCDRIKVTTVRKKVQHICDTLQIDSKDGASRRPSLVSLVLKYKPELVGQETRPEEDMLNKGLKPLASPGETEGKVEKTWYGRDPNFVGREQAITDINTLIEQGARCILILSPGGVGKTVLAERYLQQRFETVVRFDIAKEQQNVSSAESLVEEKLRFLGEEPGREFGVSLDRLRTKLESERIGILVDNLEPALGEGGRFIENHRSYVELMRVLCGSSVRSLTLITSREKVAENLDIEVYPLERLSLEAWEEYFQQKAIATDTPVLRDIHQGYQGNALAMKILRSRQRCGALSRIAADHDNSIEDYWKFHRTQEGVVVEQAIANLIIEQFNRLQQVCPTAYQLLYRMGCFRFQDVPTVPREGLLCLLWGVAEHEGLKAIRDLGDRSLIDRVNGEYKLHPLIRQEAVKRLQESDDWELANRTAAEFWRNLFEYVDNIEHLKQSFEAFHHYFAIPDYECAVEILVEDRKANWISPYPFKSKWYKQESLCELNRRLGLYTHQIIAAVTKLLPHIENLYYIARLYFSLSVSVWILGDIREAIKFYQEARKALSQEENIHIELDCIARFSEAICYLELGEIEEALLILNQVYEDAKQHNIYFYLVETSFALAATYAYLGNTDKAQVWIDKHKEYYQQYSDQIGDWAIVHRSYFLGETYKIFQDYDESKIAYEQSLEDADKTQYIQVKGKVLTRLAELYRLKKYHKTAVSYHTQSIEILEKLGAKCDLAEAYYQLGLTYQETGDLAQSQDYFNRAIELWEKINAPKQVARVRESMNS